MSSDRLISVLRGVILFQRKIFLKSIAIALIFFLLFTRDNPAMMGLYYLFLSVFIHLIDYEISYKSEYFYYYNLGLSKRTLWISTFVVSLFVFFAGVIIKRF